MFKNLLSSASISATDQNKFQTVPSPLDRKTLISILCIVISEPLNFSFLYPYVIFLIKRFGIAESANREGFYAGLLIASFYLTQFITSAGWGWLSDRFSRKWILSIGAVGNIICLICFGLVNDFWSAVTIRLISGALNGNIAVSKGALGEISDETNAAKCFNLMNLTWSIGAIAAFLIGAFFNNPAKLMPLVFGQSQFLRDNPYFLPPALCAMISAIGFAAFIVFYDIDRAKAVLSGKCDNVAINTPDLILDDSSVEKSSIETQHSVESDKSHSPITFTTSINNGSAISIKGNTIGTLEPKGLPVPVTAFQNKEIFRISSLSWLSILCFACLSYGNSVADEIFNWWAIITPDKGGLGFTSSDVGITLAVIGGIDVVFQAFLFGRLEKWFGCGRLYRWSMIICGPVIAALPSLSFIVRSAQLDPSWVGSSQNGSFTVMDAISNNSTAFSNARAHENVFDHIDEGSQMLTWFLLIMLLMIKIITQQCAYVGIMIIINQSSTPVTRGWINGLSQSAASFMRCAGPVTAGFLWSWSMSSVNIYMPIHAWYSFMVCWFLFWIGAILGFLLPNGHSGHKG